MTEQPKVGTVTWWDLTVPRAKEIRDFYEKVVGWKSEEADMGEYVDFTMIPPAGVQGVAGICHARGTNAGLPAQWLMYVVVADVEASAQACVESGGEVVDGPRSLGQGRFCVIKDPSGAVCALYEE